MSAPTNICYACFLEHSPNETISAGALGVLFRSHTRVDVIAFLFRAVLAARKWQAHTRFFCFIFVATFCKCAVHGLMTTCYVCALSVFETSPKMLAPIRRANMAILHVRDMACHVPARIVWGFKPPHNVDKV